MKNSLRFFLFLLAFQMEVRVRASGDLLQQPSSCLKTREACAIQVVGNVFHLVKGKIKLHAGNGAALVRLSEKQWRFIKGALWVEEGQDIDVETVFGSLRASQGEYWVLEQDGRIMVRNMNANLKVTLRDGKVLQLPEGFEFWLAGLNSKGVSEYGMIRPVDMREHLPMWNALYRGSKESFIKEVVQLRTSWGDLAEKSSQLYTAVAQREIASELEKRQSEERAKDQAAARRREMRELYHKRVFER